MKAPHDVAEYMVEIESICEQIKELTKRRDSLRDKVRKEVKKSGVRHFVYDDGGDKVLVARLSECKSVDFDANKLRKRLPKDVFRRIVKLSVDPKMVEAEFDRGNVKVSDLRGAFTIKRWDQFRVHRVNRSDEDD